MSGSVLTVGVVTVAASALLLAAGVASLVVDQARLQARADQIALLAEDAQRGLTTGFPCELALRAASRFGYRLDTCRILNSEVWIVLNSERLGIVTSARAHAGS